MACRSSCVNVGICNVGCTSILWTSSKLNYIYMYISFVVSMSKVKYAWYDLLGLSGTDGQFMSQKE